jgi:hypothetical protein
MKQTPVNIVVSDIVRSPFAISTEEGSQLFYIMDRLFTESKDVCLDFKDINIIVSTFLNASIGQLYSKYDSAFLKEHLVVVNMTRDDLNILKKVTDRAKEYFANKEGFENTLKDHFPDGE